MGCVMACFRGKDDDEDRRKHPLARFLPFKRKGCLPWMSQKAAARKREDMSPLCDAERLETGLVYEGKFPKDYGAVETHAKKRKGYGEINGLILDEDDHTSKKLPFSEQHFQLFSSEQMYEDSSFTEDSSARTYLSGMECLGASIRTLPSVTLSKSVDSEGSKHDSTTEAETDTGTLDLSPGENSGQVKPSDFAQSPYPTPLKVTYEMQTPFTVYPDSKRNPRPRMNASNRTQNVYPILSSVENLPEGKGSRENSCFLDQSIDSSEPEIRCSPITGENSTKFQQLSPASLYKGSPHDNRQHTDPDGAVPLCNWQTPLPAANEKGYSNVTASLMNDSHFSETPDRDETSSGFIFGAQGTYGNTPKLWDGNGIPNTTSKYKEDRKVTWHATPFVERLEKVLSHEKILPQRKLIE